MPRTGTSMNLYQSPLPLEKSAAAESAGKKPKLQGKINFPDFNQRFNWYFLGSKKPSKKKEQSATVPKDVYCYRYCFLETKERRHNDVGTCADKKHDI